MLELVIRVPGEPVAQGRPRAFYRPGLGVRVYDPAKSRNWKATAQQHMEDALRGERDVPLIGQPFIVDGPVELHVLAVFTCPRSHWRKREPIPRRPKTSKPDAENVAKAVQDAASGVLFTDDAQVCRLTVEKLIGAQGEAPYVEITVREMEAARQAGAILGAEA